jgi:hypothetical protein
MFYAYYGHYVYTLSSPGACMPEVWGWQGTLGFRGAP